jgi:hypothetical protein
MPFAMTESSTLRPGGEREMALNRPQHFSGPMSQLGQSRRFNDVPVTSALPLIADLRRKDRHVRKVPEADWCTAARGTLFDHLVSTDKQRWQDGEAEPSRGSKVYNKLKFRGLLDG